MVVKSSSFYFLIIAVSVLISVSSIRAAEEGLPYKVIFNGITNKDLLSDIQSISDSFNNIDNRVASSYLLQKMADNDIQKFLQLLKARGYYDADLKSDIDSKNDPIILTFTCKIGGAYILKSVNLGFTNDQQEDAPTLPNIRRLGLYVDQPFSSQALLNGQDEIITNIRRKGFPFVKIANRDVVVDHKDQSVTVDLKIETGPKAYFGDTTITGLVAIDESYIAGKVPWKKGDVFNGNLIEEARKKISELGLFASVRIAEGKEIDSSSRLPITIEVAERKHRSISAGLKYLTDEGPGAEIGWENRNIFHKGEKLTADLTLSKYTTSFETGFRKLDFYKNDQTFSLSETLSNNHTDAYKSKSIISSVKIDRDLSKIFSIGGGFAVKTSTTEKKDEVPESYNLLSLPLYFKMDRSNDLLDPVRGDRLSLQFTPYYMTSGERINFGKALISYKRYVRITRNPLFVIAAEVTASAIKGAPMEDIPADELLYAGGGGSIRGYAYQWVGPLNNDETAPTGGKALFESSIEFRVKVSEQFGLVAFLDGGSAFKEKIFSSEYPLRWGTGLGLRYYTGVGPFRLDIGIPLNKRKRANGSYIDDSYQIYISLGQAF